MLNGVVERADRDWAEFEANILNRTVTVSFKTSKDM